MKTLRDPECLLTQGLAAIRGQFKVPSQFPPDVLAAADRAAARTPADHADWTARPFVTLDPAGATDLDQAFAIEPAGVDWLLHYAIADVGWFVDHGDPLDGEAWQRGMTTYLPDGKAGLYPPVLAEGAASLLPDGPRPAVVFTTRVAPDGAVVLDGVTRAVIRSRAKLAYETVRDADLPDGFAELAGRITAAEQRRGAARVDPPEQEVERNGDGRFALRFRPLLPSERRNAALSLATNMAVADLLQAHRTGLFRVMAEPEDFAIARLRQTARALAWNGPPRPRSPSSKRRSIPPIRATLPSCSRCAAPGRAPATSRGAQAWCRGTRRWRPPTPTPPPRCGDWPIASWCWRRWR